MAYGCVMHRKCECDGCGWCDDCPNGLFGRNPARVSDDTGDLNETEETTT